MRQLRTLEHCAMRLSGLLSGGCMAHGAAVCDSDVVGINTRCCPAVWVAERLSVRQRVQPEQLKVLCKLARSYPTPICSTGASSVPLTAATSQLHRCSRKLRGHYRRDCHPLGDSPRLAAMNLRVRGPASQATLSGGIQQWEVSMDGTCVPRGCEPSFETQTTVIPITKARCIAVGQPCVDR